MQKQIVHWFSYIFFLWVESLEQQPLYSKYLPVNSNLSVDSSASSTPWRAKARSEMSSLHLTFGRLLSRFPEGVASRICLANLSWTFWTHGQTNEAGVSRFAEVARLSGIYEFHSCALSCKELVHGRCCIWLATREIDSAERSTNQARSQVFRFGEKNTFLGGKDFCFCYTFKKFFLDTTKFKGNAPRWLRALVAVQRRLQTAGL